METVNLMEVRDAPVVDGRTHVRLSARDSAVQMALRVVSSVEEHAFDILDAMRMCVAGCKHTRTIVQILDIINDAEMAFE